MFPLYFQVFPGGFKVFPDVEIVEINEIVGIGWPDTHLLKKVLLHLICLDN